MLQELRSAPPSVDIQRDEDILRTYLRDGSVKGVSGLRLYWLLKSRGIVPTAHANESLKDPLNFLTSYLNNGKSFKDAYGEVVNYGSRHPISYFDGILGDVADGKYTRSGAALIVVPERFPNMILFGNDITAPDKSIEKERGQLSLPMGYSEQEENPVNEATRVLQREAWSKKAIEGTFPFDFVARNVRAFMYYGLAHVSVACYVLKIPENRTDLFSFSSDKLINFRLMTESEIKYIPARGGVKEIVRLYHQIGNRNGAIVTSGINRRIQRARGKDSSLRLA